jgi:hypothetical protein
MKSKLLGTVCFLLFLTHSWSFGAPILRGEWESAGDLILEENKLKGIYDCQIEMTDGHRDARHDQLFTYGEFQLSKDNEFSISSTDLKWRWLRLDFGVETQLSAAPKDAFSTQAVSVSLGRWNDEELILRVDLNYTLGGYIVPKAETFSFAANETRPGGRLDFWAAPASANETAPANLSIYVGCVRR